MIIDYSSPTIIRLQKEFIEAKQGLDQKIGSYNVLICNSKTDGKWETQGDLTSDADFGDFFDWLISDIQEMDLGELDNLKIESVEYVGIDRYLLFEEIKKILDSNHSLVTYNMYADFMERDNYLRWRKGWCKDRDSLKEYLTYMLDEHYFQTIAMIKSDNFNPDNRYWGIDGYGNVRTTDSVDFYDELLDDPRMIDDLIEKIIDGRCDFKVNNDDIEELLMNAA